MISAAAFALPVNRRPRLPAQRPPDAARLFYFASLRDLLSAAHARVTKELLPLIHELLPGDDRTDGIRHDAEADRAKALIEKLAVEFEKDTSGRRLAALSREVARRTSDFQRNQLFTQIKQAIGLDPLILDRGLERAVAGFVKENVGLIRSLPNRYFAGLEQVVSAGVRDGARASTLAKEIEERYEVAESSARLIANDQVGKFYGALNEERQTDLGIDAYVWRTSRDNRVRDEHADREGERFLWDDPPEDGHPGEPVNCRCSAEPDLSALLGV